MNYTDFISSNGYICTESEFEIAKAHAKTSWRLLSADLVMQTVNALRIITLNSLSGKNSELKEYQRRCLKCNLQAKRNPALLRNSNTGLNKKNLNKLIISY